MLYFEWDEEKAQRNIQKHGVSFEEATTVFGDPLSLTIGDPLHSTEEERFDDWPIVSASSFVVVHTDREDNIRIISARAVTRRERKAYEEGKSS